MLYETITREAVQAMENEHGFTPNYSYQDYVTVRDEKTGETVEEYYVNLEVHKTADEVYQEWLQNKDKPSEPTKIQVLEEKVDELEVINGGLLLDQAQQNITITSQDIKLQEQEIVNANLLLEVAMLKQLNGGM